MNMTKPKVVDLAPVFRRCSECKNMMTGSRQNYNYVECGLSDVQLTNVLVYECNRCKTRVPEFPAIMGLHCLIALDLLRKPSLLSGEEIRFLRKMAGLSQKDLAEIMGIDVTRPSKWEATSAGKESDRLMRTVFLLGMIRRIVEGKDPGAIKSLAAEKFIRELDVNDVLKSIEDKVDGNKLVKVENNPAATGSDAWFLPDCGLPQAEVN